MIYTGPPGGPIRSSSYATLIKCSRGGAGQCGNVLALHPLLGRPPFRYSDLGSASDDGSGTVATPQEMSWMVEFATWLKLLGADPGGDPDDVVNGYYLTWEHKATFQIDSGDEVTAYQHIITVGPHTGAQPGTATHEYWKAWDLVLGGLREYEYILNNDGSHWTSGSKSHFTTPIGSMINAMPSSWYPDGDSIVSGSNSLEVGKDHAVWTETLLTNLGHTLVQTFTYAMSGIWNKDSMQTELDMLLSQVNLANPAQKYQIEDDSSSPRTLDAAGESITVTHEGPTPDDGEGPPEEHALRIILRSTFKPWGFADAANGWLAFNLNDITYGAIQNPDNGDDGVPEGDPDQGVYYRGGNWAAMKSRVLIPSGSYAQTIKAYQQPTSDTVSFNDAHDLTSPVIPNNNPGGWNPPTAGPPDTVIEIGGGRKNFTRGDWITLTKVTAGAPVGTGSDSTLPTEGETPTSET